MQPYFHIIPTIKDKWTGSTNKQIIIHHDNVKPHINSHDLDFKATTDSDEFITHMICQPHNYPNHNVEDLIFFRAIQSL